MEIRIREKWHTKGTESLTNTFKSLTKSLCEMWIVFPRLKSPLIINFVKYFNIALKYAEIRRPST